MFRIFIIGAAGKVGQRLVRLLATRGHQVRAMHRHAKQADALQTLGAEPVFASLSDLDAQGLSRLMTGSDAVVFTAGAGGKGGAAMTTAIDGHGLELAVVAAKRAGIQRFLLVSVFPEALRGQTVSDTFENYITVKKHADAHLAESGLDWLILRPGTLLESPGTGKVRAGVAIPYGDVTRDDVALVLATLLEQPDLNRRIIELTQGDAPVDDALQRLARHCRRTDMKLLLAGATGLVGRHLLALALADFNVHAVTALTRRALPPHEKLLAAQVDFENLPEHAAWWQADAVICTLGTALRTAGSRPAFRRVDHDYPLTIAQRARQHGTPTYVLNSAIGANPASRFFYNRVKGELERDLTTLDFQSLTCVRPGVIGGQRDEIRQGELAMKRILQLFGPVLPPRWRLNPASNIAQTLLNAALLPQPGVHVVTSDRMI